jgi:hypothetical protein
VNFQYEISNRLSREHQDVMALLDRFGRFLRAHGPEQQPEWGGAEARRIMSDLKGALAVEIPNHFAIEERELFPLFELDGGGDMVEMLLADHQLILALAREIQPLVERTLSTGIPLAQAEWEALRAQGNLFATELTSHAEKEEFGFVPALDELLDPAGAARIHDCYRAM